MVFRGTRAPLPNGERLVLFQNIDCSAITAEECQHRAYVALGSGPDFRLWSDPSTPGGGTVHGAVTVIHNFGADPAGVLRLHEIWVDLYDRLDPPNSEHPGVTFAESVRKPTAAQVVATLNAHWR